MKRKFYLYVDKIFFDEYPTFIAAVKVAIKLNRNYKILTVKR